MRVRWNCLPALRNDGKIYKKRIFLAKNATPSSCLQTVHLLRLKKSKFLEVPITEIHP
jgi:hypothetical protein